MTNRRIAVIGHGDRGMGEAIFLARTYTSDVTLLTLGVEMSLDADQRNRLLALGIVAVEEPVARIDVEAERITSVQLRSGARLQFDVFYSALGSVVRSELAVALGADCDENGALIVADHNETNIPRLYAAGDVVRGLSQIVVGLGHAAIAATHIHNQCEQPAGDPAA